MKITLNNLCKRLLVTFVVVSGVLFASVASALSPDQHRSSHSVRSDFRKVPDNDFRAVIKPQRWVRDEQGNRRSKADVVQHVKQRYNATVLKISLNEKRQVYNVRVLMPGGKIRNIQVSAHR